MGCNSMRSLGGIVYAEYIWGGAPPAPRRKSKLCSWLRLVLAVKCLIAGAGTVFAKTFQFENTRQSRRRRIPSPTKKSQSYY